MPGFASLLTDSEIWKVVQFLGLQADVPDALALTAKVDPWRPIVAPDFVFELAAHEQESLSELRGRSVALVVLYTLPRSLPRLRELIRENHALDNAGVSVVALPFEASDSREAVGANDRSIFAVAEPEVARIYALFARIAGDLGVAAPTHAEFLIDRQGYLRARWIGVLDGENERSADIRAQVEILSHERPHRPARERHAH
jgi:copper resistance protein D